MKQRQPLGAVLLVVLTTLALSACDRFDLRPSDESDNQFPRLIDEQQGRYGQVRFGSSQAEVRAAFGHPGGGDGFFPLDAESYRGPPSIKAPDGMKPTLLRYEEVAFLISSDGVFAVTVTRPEARTLEG